MLKNANVKKWRAIEAQRKKEAAAREAEAEAETEAEAAAKDAEKTNQTGDSGN